MNCCAECFLDKEIKGFIHSNSNTNGDCDFCESTNTSTINTQELQEQFLFLLDIYSIDSNGENIEIALQNDWGIFNIDSNNVKDLIASILDGLDLDYTTMLDNKIKISIDTAEGDLLISNWNNFKEEIKSENRFFNKKTADLESIKKTFPIRPYSRGKIFFRSRISDSKIGYLTEEMGKPPHKKSKSGRANPQGISYLYLAQSKDTTLYEARATHLDYVCIGEFKLKEDIKIITLRPSFQISPFTEGYSIEEYLKNKPFIDLLEKELAKPLRRQDNELDYLPTQYLCEYIKNLGYDGVEYGSSIHEGGINLVMFNDEKLECIRTKVYEVSRIEITYNELT